MNKGQLGVIVNLIFINPRQLAAKFDAFLPKFALVKQVDDVVVEPGFELKVCVAVGILLRFQFFVQFLVGPVEESRVMHQRVSGFHEVVAIHV